MKIHGLDLDNSPLISQDKSLRYAQNIAIGEGNQSYINEDGFNRVADLIAALKLVFNSTDTDIENIGTIPTNIGVVLFCIYGNLNSNIRKELIIDIITKSDNIEINKILYTETGTNNSLNFSKDRPIHGDYIYNYKNELIITFTEGIDSNANETRVINLTTPYGGISESSLIYKITNISALNLIPDVEYPQLTIDVEEGGNLKSGAYQIGIKYKLQDGSYTNYSILSVPVIVCGKYGEDIKPDIEINRKIRVSFTKPESISYEYYKLAIVHCIDTGQNCYETEDIKIDNDNENEYIISNLINYDTIILDDIFIKNIAYIREQTLVNYNNRLIRGNVQTLDYTKSYQIDNQYKNLNDILLDHSSNDIKLEQITIQKENIINSNETYFKTGEIYIPYVGYIDYKGDIINIYNIHNGCEKLNDNIYGITIQPTYIVEDFDIGYYKLQTATTRTGANYYGNIINVKFNESTITNDSNSITFETNNIDLTRGNLFEDPITFESLYTIWLKPNEIIDINLEPIIVTNDNDPNRYVEHNQNLILIHDLTNYNNYQEGEDISIGLNIDTINDTTLIHTENGYRCIYKNETNSSKLIVVFSVDSSSSNFIYDDIIYIPTKISILNQAYHKLTATIISEIPDFLKGFIKSVVYFFVEHNKYNSKILSQGLIFPDTNINNFNTTVQEYTGQFEGLNSLRFYPFEYLFNKTPKLTGDIKIIRNIRTFYDKYENDNSIIIGNKFRIDKSYSVLTPATDSDIESDTATVNIEGINILDTDINEVIDFEYKTIESCKLEYILADNTSLQNIAGDSFYRIINKSIADLPSSKDIFVGELINTDDLNFNSLNEVLQIASGIIPIKKDEETDLKGDTFLSYLTLRITTPSEDYAYGLNDKPGLDSNNTVYRWILTFPIESRFNLNARYGANIINKPYFLHNGNEILYKELLGLSYKVDNFINTDVGKGYNSVYNENGIEEFNYYEEIPGTSNHPYRIIRSLAQNPESIALNWRTFKTDDYKDLPFNRGEIIALKTDNKNLYIQQKYGLHLLQQRDQLNNDDANNSYLGTSDLFNMEPKEIVYSPSGYIGCESYFDTNVNIAGYVVIDAVHKKIFLINGDKPLEISNIKTREYFEKFIDASLRNPYNEQGRIINYNEDRNILYITQISPHLGGTKTMSFSPLNKAWVSFHTYIPDLGFVNRNGLFWGKNGKFYQPNSTIKGKYWDNTAEPSVIQFILNENTIYNKLLKTIVWKDQVSYKGDDYIQHFFKETINHIMVHNFNQCSSELNVAFNNNPKEWWNGDTGTNKINLWRFNKLFDLVINPENPFMIDDIRPDYTKLKWDISTAKPLYKWYDVNRFICQFIYLTMWCDNISVNDKYHEWELIDVHPEWQLDNRNDQTYGNKDNNQ